MNTNNSNDNYIIIKKELQVLRNIINKQKKRIYNLEKKYKDNKPNKIEKDTIWIPSPDDLKDLSIAELEFLETSMRSNLDKTTPLNNNTKNNNTKNNNTKKNNTKNNNTKNNNTKKFKRNCEYIEYNEDLDDVIEVEITDIELKNLKRGCKNKDELLNKIMDKAKDKANPKAMIDRLCKDKYNDINMSYTDILRIKNQCIEYIDIQDGIKQDISDIEYFILSSDKKRTTILESLKKLKLQTNNDTPYKLKVLGSSMDDYTKKMAMTKILQLENMESSNSEYYKLKNWLDTLLNIPWGEYKNIDLQDKNITDYLTESRKQMDMVIYGQDETKDIIIQIISKMLSNPNKCGNVFAVYGPPGVGKTTIIKEGMSKALGIPFAFLSLGGATDSSYLDGHNYTYEGSNSGKIVDILKRVGSMNPIFYFDELDKISETRKGDEITNLLIHLTDTSQHSNFQDKYLGNINIDLSKSIFVFSFNDINKVNPILLDRMELIYVNGFTLDEKRVITKNYLLPDLLKTYNLYLDTIKSDLLQPDTNHTTPLPFITITNECIDYIIQYTELKGGYNNLKKEDGVRQLKRRLEKICSQLNIVKLTNGKWNTGIHSILDNIPELKKNNTNTPIILTNTIIDKLLTTKSINDNNALYGMYN